MAITIHRTVANVLIVEPYQHQCGAEMVQVIICAMLVVYLIKSTDPIDPHHEGFDER